MSPETNQPPVPPRDRPKHRPITLLLKIYFIKRKALAKFGRGG